MYFNTGMCTSEDMADNELGPNSGLCNQNCFATDLAQCGRWASDGTEASCLAAGPCTYTAAVTETDLTYDCVLCPAGKQHYYGRDIEQMAEYLGCFHDNGPGLPRDMGNPNLPRDQRDDDPAHIFFGVSGNHKSVHDPEEPSLNVDDLADGGGTRYCIEYCARLGGYKYAGLQWVDECWCGESTRYLVVALPSPLSSRRGHRQAMSTGILVPLTSKRK
jgi:hypothetical protein